ncbi:MAG: hypothetical protein DWQ05_18215 [Calditrichaeota bacterium]|nr:MAG: hypothetical protein DWQ05_18215 [Calditrichota bacterium]
MTIMLENLKKLSRGTAVYGFGHILTRSIAFVLLPLYTNFLAPAELGIVTLVAAFLAMMNLFFIYGFDSAFLRFYITEKNRDEKRIILSTCYLTVLASSIIFSILIYITSPDIARLLLEDRNFAHLIKISAAILAIDALVLIPLLLLRAQEKSTQFILIKVITVVLNIGLNLLFVVWLEKGVAGVFYAQLGASLGGFLLTMPVVFPNLIVKYSAVRLKEHLAFGLPYLPTTFAVILMEIIDRFFLLQFKGAAEVGIYGAGYRLAMIMSLLIAGFRFAWHPFFLSVSQQENVKKLFARVLTYFLLICTSFYLAICFFIEDIVRFEFRGISLFNQAYWHSTSIVPIVMLAYIFFGVYAIIVVGIHLTKKTKYLPLITFCGAISNIFGNWFLIPEYGMYGAAWATVFSYAIMTVVLYIITQKLYPISYELKRVLKIFIIVLFIYIINSSFYLSVFFKICLLLGMPLLLTVFHFWLPEERTWLGKIKVISIDRLKSLFI